MKRKKEIKAVIQEIIETDYGKNGLDVFAILINYRTKISKLCGKLPSKSAQKFIYLIIRYILEPLPKSIKLNILANIITSFKREEKAAGLKRGEAYELEKSENV
ncbi:MAG: hypothetical protein ACE5IT_01705 [bacterium]